jgi:hypothetical protein
MSPPNYSEKRVLQELAIDAAYTFKGLHKTADSLEITRRLFLMIPIAFSVIVLIFQSDVPAIVISVLAALSLLVTIFVLLNEKEYDKTRAYRELANKFKTIYDELRVKYDTSDPSNLDALTKRINDLRLETSEFPVSRVGRVWSKLTISGEMNLDWTRKN